MAQEGQKTKVTKSTAKPQRLYIIWDKDKITHQEGGGRWVRPYKMGGNGRMNKVFIPGARKLVDSFKTRTIESAKKILSRRNTDNMLEAIFVDASMKFHKFKPNTV